MWAHGEKTVGRSSKRAAFCKPKRVKLASRASTLILNFQFFQNSEKINFV